jgi:hypothetical protein
VNAKPQYYEIRVQGHLRAAWSDWFGQLTIRHEANGVTVLAGPIADQAALHGVLARIRDLGLTLLAINPDTPPALIQADANPE